MICEKFQSLTNVEKIIFIGKLQHACQSSDLFFDMATRLIQRAERKKIFHNVKILPYVTDEIKIFPL